MTSTNAFVPQFWNDFAAVEPCSGDIKDTYRWARSFFVSTTGNVSSDTIRWYVETQKTRS